MSRLLGSVLWTGITLQNLTIGAAVIVPNGLMVKMAAPFHSRSTSPDHLHLKRCARQIFDAGVQAVLPQQMVKDALLFYHKLLTVNHRQYAVDHNIHIVGFGKAVAGMVRAAEDVLGDEVVDGIASIPSGIQQTLHDLHKEDLLPSAGSKVKLIEGAKNNLPDFASLQASVEITALADRLTDMDIMLVLISGGGSALLPAPTPPISLEDKLDVIRVLTARGASIQQLNTVRKNLSTLKGGRLARIASPAKVISLILSDIIGDPVDLIASGPTVPDYSTPHDCLKIFKLFCISNRDIPASINQYLQSPDVPNLQPTHKESVASFPPVNNVIIGSNLIAVSKAAELARNLGFAVCNISNAIDREARTVAETFTDIATFICEIYKIEWSNKREDKGQGQNSKPWFTISNDKMEELNDVVKEAAQCAKPVCIIGAGETTVTIRGTGRGGRNQELALAAGVAMNASPLLQKFSQDGFRVVLLSAGTDGQDGPTDAAGAFADLGLVTRAIQSGLDIDGFLKNNDSYTFYKTLNSGEDLVVTGLTGTNVMDVQILLVCPPNR